jgi:HEAT repeat protein
MLNLDNLAVTVGRALDAFRRGPAAVPDQKVALRALVALLRLGGAVLRAEDGELWIGERRMSPSLPGVRTLLTQCEGHDVDEIHLPKDAAPASLLHLLRALAEPVGRSAGAGSVVERLQRAGVTDVRVVSSRQVAPKTESPPRPLTEVTTERVTLADALQGAPRLSRPEAAVASIALEAEDADVSAHLDAAAGRIGEELQHGRPSGAVRAVAQLIHLEETSSDPDRQVALRQAVGQLVDRPLLEGALDCARDEGMRTGALRVLERAGSRASGVVRDRLLAASDPADLQHCFDVLRTLPDGIRGLILQLQAPNPRVVQRSAEVLGILGVREAAPVLTRIVVHNHAGVRIAAATALARIATPDAIEGLAALLAEQDRELRLAAARALGGIKVGSLVAAVEQTARRETEDDVVLEYGRALGRIGTPEAVSVLVRWAAAPGWRFWRRHMGIRLAAVEGLRAAGSAQAVRALRGLTEDADADVRRAATEALEDRSIAAGAAGP